jgi:hypothetical protein
MMSLILGMMCFAGRARAQTVVPKTYYSATNSLGFLTNAPAVVTASYYARTSIFPNVWANRSIPETLPKAARQLLLERSTQAITYVYFFTNQTFDHFLPDSLQQVTWTNLMAETNGRSTLIWSEREHGANWPASPPSVQWNTHSLLWGKKGMTSLCPCWEGEGSPGVVPIAALTRRHGYSRGHGMGADGFGKTFAGKRVWFVSTNNSVVEVRIVRDVVRTMSGSGRDYTLFLFDRDLPNSIEPIRVADLQEVFRRYGFSDYYQIPCPLFYVEQTGNVSAGLPGFTVAYYKGGDSGSANLLPLPNELVFFGGRTTSSPTPEMQVDMDELCREQGLNPGKYQMQWADLSRWPKYYTPPGK